MFRVLMIDDCKMTLLMLSKRLERRGFEVIAADSGSKGILLAEAHRPDLILMDLSMPEMDGRETTRMLKSAEATRQIPILALTSLARRKDVEEAFHAGCDDYETKPFDFERLIVKMTALVMNRR